METALTTKARAKTIATTSTKTNISTTTINTTDSTANNTSVYIAALITTTATITSITSTCTLQLRERKSPPRTITTPSPLLATSHPSQPGVPTGPIVRCPGRRRGQRVKVRGWAAPGLATHLSCPTCNMTAHALFAAIQRPYSTAWCPSPCTMPARTLFPTRQRLRNCNVMVVLTFFSISEG